MGSVGSVITKAAGFISRNFDIVKNFLSRVVMIMERIEQIIRIGKLIIKLVREARGWFAKFFSSDSKGDQGDDDQDAPLATTRVDKDNIDAVVSLTERLESRYG